MVGRPRKKGRRQPNGQLARTYVNPRQQVASQPHRMLVAARYREWPEAESEFGRLMLNRHITPAQYEAGKRYAHIAARMRFAMGYPPLHPVGIDLIRVKGAGGELPPHVAKAICREYDDAFCEVAPHRVQRALSHHVIFERKIDDFRALEFLRIGLDKLVKYFGIDPVQPLDVVRRMSDSRT